MGVASLQLIQCVREMLGTCMAELSVRSVRVHDFIFSFTPVNSSQQQPQQSTGGLFTVNSFCGLGGKASNPTANPFGSLHSSSSSSTTSTSAFENNARSGVIRPASGMYIWLSTFACSLKPCNSQTLDL